MVSPGGVAKGLAGTSSLTNYCLFFSSLAFYEVVGYARSSESMINLVEAKEKEHRRG